MLVVKFLKTHLKDPLFWLFVALILVTSLLSSSVGINSLNAQTQVSGDGTAGYLVRWVLSTTYSCTGSIPVGYEAYDLEESDDLITNTNWSYSATDTSTKCQYKSVIVYPCTISGSPSTIPPSGMIACPGDGNSLSSDEPWFSVSNLSNCTLAECEYYAPCSPTIWNPSPLTVCNGTNLTQTSDCGTTRQVLGTKSCPTCVAAFDTTSVTSPGSSILTWSSIDAVNIKYTCTGPLSGSADYGIYPVNSSELPNPVIFNFPLGPTETEICTFTVKDNTGEVNTCSTGNVVVIPHTPTCTLSANKTLIPSGDPLDLTWTSTYAQSGSISDGGGNALPVEAGTKTINPTVTTTQDITYTGTFDGYGGTFTCPISSAVKVIANPPAIISGSFKVLDTKTGHNPEAEWKTENVVKCEIESDTGFPTTTVCSSKATCADVSNYEINKVIMEETAYTLTCYHELYFTYPTEPGLKTTATFTPLPKFTFSGDPLEVEIEFKGGSATTVPSVELEAISWNGYLNDIVFTSDFSELPESPGDETANHLILKPNPLTFNQYYTSIPSIKSLLEIFASYRFSGQKTVEICGNGSANCIDITITGTSTIPTWEPI